MDRQIEHDPQQYHDEWFNVAFPLGKEFELPSVSNMSSQFFVNNTNLSLPNLSLQNRIIQTNTPLTEMGGVCNTEIQLARFPRIAVRPSAITGNRQAYVSSLISDPAVMSFPISTSQIYVRSYVTSQSYGPRGLTAMSNQHSRYHIPVPSAISLNDPTTNLPLRNQQIYVAGSSSPPFLFAGAPLVGRDQAHFSGVPNYNPRVPSMSSFLRNTIDANRSINVSSMPTPAPSVMNHFSHFNTGRIMSNPSGFPTRVNQPSRVANTTGTIPYLEIGRGSSTVNNLSTNLPRHSPSLSSGLNNSISLENIMPKPNSHVLGESSWFNITKNPNKRLRSELNDSSKQAIAQENFVLNGTITTESSSQGDHKCFICNASFASGSALGGHMSSHTKKLKIDAINSGQFFKIDSFSGFRDSSRVQDGSEASTVVSLSPASINKKIEGNESSKGDEVAEESMKSEAKKD